MRGNVEWAESPDSNTAKNAATAFCYDFRTLALETSDTMTPSVPNPRERDAVRQPTPDLTLAASKASAFSHEAPLLLAGRIPALDGLRGVAILLVLLWHGLFEMNANSRVLSGLLALGKLSWSGVDLFFVLSGFLIGGILLDAKDSPHYFTTFYIRRAYRILPLYFAVIGVAYSIGHLSTDFGWLGADLATMKIPWASYPTFTQNLWMAYLGTYGSFTLAATWSLAVEEQFYLTAPLLIRKVGQHVLTYIHCDRRTAAENCSVPQSVPRKLRRLRFDAMPCRCSLPGYAGGNPGAEFTSPAFPDLTEKSAWLDDASTARWRELAYLREI